MGGLKPFSLDDSGNYSPSQESEPVEIPIRESQRVFPLRAQYLILSPKDDEEDSLSVRDTLSDPAKENWQKAK